MKDIAVLFLIGTAGAAIVTCAILGISALISMWIDRSTAKSLEKIEDDQEIGI